MELLGVKDAQLRVFSSYKIFKYAKQHNKIISQFKTIYDSYLSPIDSDKSI